MISIIYYDLDQLQWQHPKRLRLFEVGATIGAYRTLLLLPSQQPQHMIRAIRFKAYVELGFVTI
jgi:hypothetical protein